MRVLIADAGIKPKKIDHWFVDFKNLRSVDLSKLDTSDENMHTRLPVPRDIDLIGAHIIPSFSNKTSMHQLKGRHGLTVSLVLSLAVYVQFPLLALDFRHGIQNESSSQRKGGNKHERYG